MKAKHLITLISAILICFLFGISAAYAGTNNVASITLSATPLSAPNDGVSSIAVTANLLDSSGLGVDTGTAATFVVTGGALFPNGTATYTGTTLVAAGSTGAGVLVVSLTSPASGIMTISCTASDGIVGHVTQYTTVSFNETGSISLAASPTWIPADGRSSSAITATVKGVGGAAVSNGTPVTFTTTLGVFSNGHTTITVDVSNSAGTVSVSLISAINLTGTAVSPGLATITCTSNFITQNVTVGMGVGSITLTANPTSIAADGFSSSTIKAVIDDSAGAAVSAGTSVTFITTLGTFSNGLTSITLGTTDFTGVVTVSLISGTTSGSATVTCTANGVTQSVFVSIGTLPIASVTLSASPVSLPADDASSSTITATVLDVSGNPLNKNSVPVTFTTTLGKFSNGLDHITVSTIYLDPNTYPSSAWGKVVVSLIAGNAPGTALITCNAGGVTQALDITIGTSAQISSVTLSANPTSLPADGASSSTITATLLDVSGNPLNISNIPVIFTTTLGTFSNASNTITLDTQSSATGVAGKVVVSLIAGTISGTALITCDAGGVTQTTNITIGTSAQISSITLSANPTSLPADGASSSTITAQLLDISGNPVNQSNLLVTFLTTLGKFSNGLNSITVTTQGGAVATGKVVVSLIAGNTAGTAIITCSASGVTQVTNVTIGTSAQIASITLSANPSSIPADGASSSTVTAQLLDAYGNAVNQSNISVVFTTTLGTFSNGLSSITITTQSAAVATGKVVVSLIAGTTSGIALIKCTAGGVTQATNVSIGTTAQVASLTLSASPSLIPADGVSSTAITAKLLDINGNPVNQANISVVFTTTLGTFSNGLASITISTPSAATATGSVIVSLVAGATPGIALVTCSADGVTQATNVTIGTSAQIASITLTANPTSLPADGASSSTLTALLLDSSGNPINASNILVTFKTTLGTFSNGTNTITLTTQSSAAATGKVVVSLIAGTTSGIAIVTCTASGVTQATNVGIGATSQIASILLSANPSSLPADGASSSTITAQLIDASGNPVTQPNILVTFRTTLGTFSNGTNTITVATQVAATGNVVVSLIAGTTSGIAVITCSASGVTQATNVTIGTSAQVASITLTANPVSIPADGASSSTITAQLLDINGNPVSQSGISVTFTTTLGTFSNGLQTITVTTQSATVGKVIMSLIAGTSSGTAVITCKTNGVTQATTISIGSGAQVASIVLTANPATLPSTSTSFSTITATVYNGSGQLVSGGVTIAFTTNLGYFSNEQQVMAVNTNALGVATAYVYSEGIVGTAQIGASSSGVTSYTFVNFTGSGPTASIQLTANPQSTPSNALSFSTITAVLYDNNGLTVASGVQVNFTTSLGDFSNNQTIITAYTNNTGTATVEVYSGGIVGTAKISASSNGITSYVYVGFTGSGPTADITLTASPSSIASDNVSFSTITATVHDSQGQVVVAGVAVTFNTTLGIFSNKAATITAYTNGNGIAIAYLYAGNFVGLAQVSAGSNGITRFVNVIFTGPGPAASIALNASTAIQTSAAWVPAIASTQVLIAAQITDIQGNDVAAGTTATFMTTTGYFSNGQTTIVTATSGNKGIAEAILLPGRTPGTATVTCTSGNITASISILLLKQGYETEPNNDMTEANPVSFNNVYVGQLGSPYDEDWYVFRTLRPSTVSINFITTAISAASSCTNTNGNISGVPGTYRVDIRDENNDELMSYQNFDCIPDNGLWSTGLSSAGTYYIVVYCPRQPNTSHYLSNDYYMAVFDQ